MPFCIVVYHATQLCPFAVCVFFDLSHECPYPLLGAVPLLLLPPPRARWPPAPCSDRSPLIVPDELLHFPANVRRGGISAALAVSFPHTPWAAASTGISKNRPGLPRVRSEPPTSQRKPPPLTTQALSPTCWLGHPSPKVGG